MKGCRLAAEERHNEAMTLAWHTGACSRLTPMPKLTSMLIRSTAALGRQQSSTDMLHAMRAWVSATKH